MRTSKILLLAIAAPLAVVLAGGGSSATASASVDDSVAVPAQPAAAGATGPVVVFPWPLDCSVILCSPGTYCEDTQDGPICVPFPDDTF
ncbi:MAG: hypothetical protein K0V04_40300 [Deltaproteobacteria bacterium]|nr:hypothetical protein [Deltaproteobacteria bacterium]